MSEFKKYSNLKFKSEEDVRLFASIYNILKSANILHKYDVRDIFLSLCDKNIKNSNDLYFNIFTQTRGLKKVAYPSMREAEKAKQYDVDRWAAFAYKIYDSMNNENLSFHKALDKYTKLVSKDEEERVKFRQWINYYRDGEHKKYSSEDNMSKDLMKKIANYQSGLIGPGFYPPDYSSVESSDVPVEQVATPKEGFVKWKGKLYQAIRRVDKILREGDDYLDGATQADLVELLHRFDLSARQTRLESTAAEMALAISDGFRKKGFYKGSEILEKFAQDAGVQRDQEPLLQNAPAPQEQQSSPETTEAPAATPTDAPPTEVAPQESTSNNPGGDAVVRSVSDIANPDEYKDLEQSASLELAARKLEDVAARLADRRTIRLLAEFDIILDKLGLAAMFPELSEAQSKLIDAYSYALVRTTRMLGMLASGRSISEISDAKKVEINNEVAKDVNKQFGAEPMRVGDSIAPEESKKKNINEELGKKTEEAPKQPAEATPEV
jgi:hypothetical protein